VLGADRVQIKAGAVEGFGGLGCGSLVVVVVVIAALVLMLVVFVLGCI